MSSSRPSKLADWAVTPDDWSTRPPQEPDAAKPHRGTQDELRIQSDLQVRAIADLRNQLRVNRTNFAQALKKVSFGVGFIKGGFRKRLKG